jgi:cation:H+ antiporter
VAGIVVAHGGTVPDWLLLAIGLILLLGGGEGVVRGAASLARSFGVSPLAIGLLVVAFGTSAPELAVNVTASFEGQSALSFGNVVGSNMANIGLVVGMCGLLRPLRIESVVVSREIPMMLLATAAAIVMASDSALEGHASSFDRSDAIVMLLFFGVFLYYTLGELIRQRLDHATLDELVASELPGVGPRVTLARDSLVLLSGFGALLYGASLTVDAAVGMARSFGVSEVVIGISLVAVGTSLPELATSAMATLRGHMEIAIGNVIGSNVFNLLFVLAVTAFIRPIPIPPNGLLDLGMTAALSVALLALSLTGGRRIMRAQATLLVVAYLAYAGWRSATG